MIFLNFFSIFFVFAMIFQTVAMAFWTVAMVRLWLPRLTNIGQVDIRLLICNLILVGALFTEIQLLINRLIYSYYDVTKAIHITIIPKVHKVSMSDFQKFIQNGHWYSKKKSVEKFVTSINFHIRKTSVDKKIYWPVR